MFILLNKSILSIRLEAAGSGRKRNTYITELKHFKHSAGGRWQRPQAKYIYY